MIVSTKFPLFDDDKPSDHQSKGQKYWCQNSNLRSPMHTRDEARVRISLKQADQSKHGHTYLPPFDIIEKVEGTICINLVGMYPPPLVMRENNNDTSQVYGI